MVKGLPAIAFQGISLLVFLSFQKKIKLLFSWQHFVGISTLLIPLGIYYYFYFTINPGSSHQVFFRIFDESLIKAVPLLDSTSETIGKSEKSFWSYIPYFLKHIALFPVKTLYNMLPWAILAIFTFRRGFLNTVNTQDPLLKYSFWILFFNVLIYWFSPGTDHTKIKYYTFLFPLIYFTILWFYNKYYRQEIRKTTFLYYIFYGISLVVALSPLAAPFYTETRNLPYIIPVSILLFATMGFLTLILFKTKTLKLHALIMLVIVARIGFNLIMQPVYVAGLTEVKFKSDAIEAGKIIGNEEVTLCTYVNEDVTFYITREINRILPLKHPEKYNETGFYILDHNQMATINGKNVSYKLYYEFACENEDKKLFLVKFPPQ